jgi:hypothetical protein
LENPATETWPTGRVLPLENTPTNGPSGLMENDCRVAAGAPSWLRMLTVVLPV